MTTLIVLVLAYVLIIANHKVTNRQQLLTKLQKEEFQALVEAIKIGEEPIKAKLFN